MNETTKEKIESMIKENKVFLFMKGNPQMPMCGFSLRDSEILQVLDVDFASFNVLEDNEIREGIKEFSDWQTIPQLYIDQKFIGGCDIVEEMFDSGELETLLKE